MRKVAIASYGTKMVTGRVLKLPFGSDGAGSDGLSGTFSRDLVATLGDPSHKRSDPFSLKVARPQHARSQHAPALELSHSTSQRSTGSALLPKPLLRRPGRQSRRYQRTRSPDFLSRHSNALATEVGSGTMHHRRLPCGWAKNHYSYDTKEIWQYGQAVV